MFYIGNVKIENRIVVAPMAGITDIAYRLILKQFGAALLFTELVSGKGIFYNNENTKYLTMTDEKEKPVALQLFGNEPKIMAFAAKKYEDRFDIIDVNMGCPVKKIVNNNEGSALLKDVKLAYSIVREMVKSVNIPITCKIRIGFDDNNKNYLEFAKAMEEAGASAITVHGRTRTQMYSGKCDLDAIREIKENVKIPVIGNGNIFTIYDAKEMIDYTKCDAVALARGVKGNPFFLKECIEYLENNKVIKKPSIDEIKKVMLTHIEMEMKYKSEEKAISEIKNQLCCYLKNFKYNKNAKLSINISKTRKEVENIINNFFN